MTKPDENKGPVVPCDGCGVKVQWDWRNEIQLCLECESKVIDDGLALEVGG